MMLYKAPVVRLNNEIQPSDYLVEECSNYCLIHRVVKPEEIDNYDDVELHVTMEGQYVIPRIAKCSSLENAEIAIRSYWAAVCTLKQR
ncbi:hypothetical protein [Paenibacillus sp. SN-8-1]|uniref:hypothetical protein n=1 Tax=Paenibacillus sp. SN-8-1 TaxID=3435409 RepID=UPI003D9A4A3C